MNGNAAVSQSVSQSHTHTHTQPVSRLPVNNDSCLLMQSRQDFDPHTAREVLRQASRKHRLMSIHEWMQ